MSSNNVLASNRVLPSDSLSVNAGKSRGSQSFLKMRLASRESKTRSMGLNSPRWLVTSVAHHPGGMSENHMPGDRDQHRSHALAMDNFEGSSSAKPGRL